MSRWISITVADLNDAKLASYVTALRTKALDAGQTDPAPRLTQAVADRIRRKIASCRQNRLDADATTIPQGLKEMAVDFILADLKGRLEIALEPDEGKRIATWEKDLGAIARCEEVVEQPDDAIAAPVQTTAGTPSILSDRRPYGDSDGL